MSFQEVLSEAEASLDTTLNHEVSALLKRVGATVAVAEALTEGALMQRILKLSSDPSFLLCSIVCTNPATLVHVGDVQATTIKTNDYSLMAAELVKGLFRKTNSPVCISTAGVLGYSDSEQTYESKCYFSFLIQGQLFQKFIVASGDKEAVLSTLSQASFVFLKHVLEVGFHLLPEEENDGRE